MTHISGIVPDRTNTSEVLYTKVLIFSLYNNSILTIKKQTNIFFLIFEKIEILKLPLPQKKKKKKKIVEFINFKKMNKFGPINISVKCPPPHLHTQKFYYHCLIIVVTFSSKFHTQSVITIMGQIV